MWIGGLRPNATRLVLVDVNDDPPAVIVRATANSNGVVSCAIPKTYRNRDVELRLLDTWFKNQQITVRVESYGLFRAMLIERDYAYSPGGSAITENPPQEVDQFSPEKSFEAANARSHALIRSRTYRVRLWLYNAIVAVMTSLVVSRLTNPAIGGIALLVASFGLRAFMQPYLSGHKTASKQILVGGLAVPILMAAFLAWQTWK